MSVHGSNFHLIVATLLTHEYIDITSKYFFLALLSLSYSRYFHQQIDPIRFGSSLQSLIHSEKIHMVRFFNLQKNRSLWPLLLSSGRNVGNLVVDAQ
jgi:hypothetical protein